MRFALAFATHLGIPIADQVHFIGLLSDLLSACDERRFGEYENESWWRLADAEHRSALDPAGLYRRNDQDFQPGECQ